jgi:MFS family permease
MIFAGWIIGSPIAGWLSDFIQRRKILLVISCFFCVLLLMLITYNTQLSPTELFISFFALGFFTSFSGLTFAMGCELNPKTTGTAIGFVNMIAIIPSIIITPLFGKILDANWTGAMEHGARVFSAFAYQRAMVLEYGVVIFALVIAIFFMRESYSKPQ